MAVLSVTLDFVQEIWAENAVEALRRTVAVRVQVRRDGVEVSEPVDQLVPGDVVHLAAGDLVPADCRLIEARDLFVNQAMLTGEPYPAEKRVDASTTPARDPGEAVNTVFMGTSVISGNALALVCRTGDATALGQLSGTLMAPPPPTAFELGVRQFGFLILRLTIFLVLFVLAVNVLFHRPWLESRVASKAPGRGHHLPHTGRDRLGEDRRGALRLRAAARFSSRRRRDGAAAGGQGGAAEDVLQQSTHYEAEAGAVKPLDPAARAELDALFQRLGEDGFRVLAIASKTMGPEHTSAALGDESELAFAGYAVFLDPPKTSAMAAIHALTGAGVIVRILTGDNERVTRHVCVEPGLPVTGLITGDDLRAMSEEALRARLAKVNVFCRVTPQQKERMLLAYKRSGRVVGFLGDGINDASAIHAADVGISVDSAADVAKEAAGLILLEHDLSVVHEAVKEGRRTVQNVTKYILMGSSSNFGNMFSMAGASLFLPFLPMLPIHRCCSTTCCMMRQRLACRSIPSKRKRWPSLCSGTCG